MPVMIQCVNVPTGASGSWTTIATAAELSGTPDHDSGGDTLSPLHVYLSGMRAPFTNAVLVNLSVLVTGGLFDTVQLDRTVPTMRSAASPRISALYAKCDRVLSSTAARWSPRLRR